MRIRCQAAGQACVRRYLPLSEQGPLVMGIASSRPGAPDLGPPASSTMPTMLDGASAGLSGEHRRA
jgi:hypothetical protein